MKKKLLKLSAVVGALALSYASFAGVCELSSPVGVCTTDGNCGWDCGLVGLGASTKACWTSRGYCCRCIYTDNTYECGLDHHTCVRRVSATSYTQANSQCSVSKLCEEVNPIQP